ncbi:hypothetical protein [Salinigranum salinum]|uniref:hypothetical protein n=1 Tax=Salinigranum salinum TaxID=1364937 RepID=UPI001261196B|nr:hypothetical protein [Salinigranum salinum]
MATENRSSGGIVLDTSLILRSVRYYAVIGGGLGLLGIVLLTQFGGGEGMSGAIMNGILSMVVVAFAVLSGPLIAAFIGYATAEDGVGDIRSRSVNSGIANGIGFAVFGIIVSVLLLVGLSAVVGSGGDGGATASSSSGGGPIELGKLVTLVVLMVVPNSLVGGTITFFLEGRGGASPR